jgi:tripartite-type tricarboxylate transporter receptor subunit TctC
MLRPWSITKTMRPEWLREGKINLLVQYALARHPELPNVPAVVDLAQTAEQRQVLALYASGSDIGRSIVAPPGVPADTVVVLRRAFREAMRDPGLLADVARSGTDIDPVAGERLQEIVRQAVAIPPRAAEQAKRFAAPQR